MFQDTFIHIFWPSDNWNGRFTLSGKLFGVDFTFGILPRYYSWNIELSEWDDGDDSFELCVGPFFEFICSWKKR